VKTTAPLVLAVSLLACDAAKGPGAASSASSAPSSRVASSSAPVGLDAPPPSGVVVSASPAAPPPRDDDRLELTGKVTQGALLVARIKGGGRVRAVKFPGHRVDVPPDGVFPIVFGRNAPKREEMKLTLEDGTEIVHVFDTEPRTYEKDVIDGLPDAEVRVEGKDKKAQEAVDARIEAARMKKTEGQCWAEGFAWPAKGKVTSRYGQPRTLNGLDGGLHWGVDVAIPNGTPVAAPACGTIVFAELDVPMSGGTLVIDHGHGVTSSFLHLSAFTKKVGDVVKQGDIVAKSGSTGRATGPHLDWRMSYFEVRIDPELLVPPMPAK
jgi:murein DD-endopeptidase MepM/ murein hydrolase activator NlpD